jgi:hypothetical protein
VIKTSEQINEISLALSQAQSQMGFAQKSSINPHFKSKYANLEALIDATKKPLADNGLAIFQGSDVSDGQLIVSTRLLHKSGQWLETQVIMRPKDMLPQSIGSALTYGKRYGWGLVTGISGDEDDDGNIAQNGASQPKASAAENYWEMKFDKNNERWQKAFTSYCDKGRIPEDMRSLICARLHGQQFKNIHGLVKQAKIEGQHDGQ